MQSKITLDASRGYSTEARLMAGLQRFGFVDADGVAKFSGHVVNYLVCRKPDGNWTAVFMLSQCLRINNLGGYVGVYAERSFLTI